MSRYAEEVERLLSYGYSPEEIRDFLGDEMSWQNEVFKNPDEYLIDASVDDHGAPVPAVMFHIIKKFAPKGAIIEGTYYDRGCKFCGTINGLHGYSFAKKKW